MSGKACGVTMGQYCHIVALYLRWIGLSDSQLEKEKCVHVFRVKNRWGHIAECLEIQNLAPRLDVPKFGKTEANKGSLHIQLLPTNNNYWELIGINYQQLSNMKYYS